MDRQAGHARRAHLVHHLHDSSLFGIKPSVALVMEALGQFRESFKNPADWNRKACQGFDDVLVKMAASAYDTYTRSEMDDKISSVKVSLIENIKSQEVRSKLAADNSGASGAFAEHAQSFNKAATDLKNKKEWELMKARMLFLCVSLVCLSMAGSIVYSILPTTSA